MSCELFKSEMYAWRPGSNVVAFQPLFDHLEKCPECKRLFKELTAADQSIRRSFQEFPEDRTLESRILAGLAHQRAETTSRRIPWRRWLLLPMAASVTLIAILGVRPWLQELRLNREITALLSKPPEVQISSSDRQQLLHWSTNALAGLSSLPAQLSKVEFRGAASLSIDHHQAVLLKMKNERRASLLIVNALLTREPGFKAFRTESGSASLWSDGARTYVLLYQGTLQEMHAYMAQMGIGA